MNEVDAIQKFLSEVPWGYLIIALPFIFKRIRVAILQLISLEWVRVTCKAKLINTLIATGKFDFADKEKSISDIYYIADILARRVYSDKLIEKETPVFTLESK